jgi:hypothetical protein
VTNTPVRYVIAIVRNIIILILGSGFGVLGFGHFGPLRHPYYLARELNY